MCSKVGDNGVTDTLIDLGMIEDFMWVNPPFLDWCVTNWEHIHHFADEVYELFLKEDKDD